METVVALAHMVGREFIVINLFLVLQVQMEDIVKTEEHQLAPLEIVDVHVFNISLETTVKLMKGSAI